MDLRIPKKRSTILLPRVEFTMTAKQNDYSPLTKVYTIRCKSISHNTNKSKIAKNLFGGPEALSRLTTTSKRSRTNNKCLNKSYACFKDDGNKLQMKLTATFEDKEELNELREKLKKRETEIAKLKAEVKALQTELHELKIANEQYKAALRFSDLYDLNTKPKKKQLLATPQKDKHPYKPSNSPTNIKSPKTTNEIRLNTLKQHISPNTKNLNNMKKKEYVDISITHNNI